MAQLDDVANQEKMLPRDYITEDGFHITAKARRYLQPADRGRGLPAVQGRPAAVRAAEERAGAARSSPNPLWYSSAPFFASCIPRHRHAARFKTPESRTKPFRGRIHVH